MQCLERGQLNGNCPSYGEESGEIVSGFAFGLIDGHIVEWKVRRITWCRVCEQRESTSRAGLCARCVADSRLLVLSALDARPGR
jgi:hypothetical protein